MALLLRIVLYVYLWTQFGFWAFLAGFTIRQLAYMPGDERRRRAETLQSKR